MIFASEMSRPASAEVSQMYTTTVLRFVWAQYSELGTMVYTVSVRGGHGFKINL